MVTVKRLFPMYVLALLALMFVGCGDDAVDDAVDGPVDPLADAVLAVSATTAEVGAEGEPCDAIEVTNSGNAAALRWQVSSSDAWVTFTTSSGATPGTFQIGGETNETGAERSGTATVEALDLDQAALTITVTQPTTGPMLCVSETEWTAAALGEESPYIHVTNCGNANSLDWQATEDADWLTLSATSGSTPDSFTITAEPNNTGVARDPAYVVITEVGGEPDTIVVTQPVVVSLGSLGFDTDGSACDVFVSGDYLYVADGVSGLVTFDLSGGLSDQTELILAASYPVSNATRSVHVFGDYAYLTEGGVGIEIVDISNPYAPTQAGDFNTAGAASDAYVRFGDTAYVADYDEGLQILDISDVANVTDAGGYDTPGITHGVHVSGSYAYLANGATGLVIMDISVAGNPTLAGTFTITGDIACGVDAVGDRVYVVEEATGLHIVDASTAGTPVEVGAFDTDGDALGVRVFGDYAYIADGDNGLLVIDISDPTAPVLVGSYDTPGEASAVYVSGGYAFVADRDNGVVVLRLEL